MDKFFYIIILIILFGVFLIFSFKKKKKKLTKSKKQYFLKVLRKIEKQDDLKNTLIDYDKLFHKVLIEMGYKGDLGFILKQNPKEILNINKVWDCHKLRNKLVHEFISFKEQQLLEAVNNYSIELKHLFNI